MIDWNRVNELREAVGTDDFHEVVDLFIEEVDETIGRLIESPDPSLYESDLHFLKGSALNLGFRDFAALCADFERKLATGGSDQIDIGRVIATYQGSRSEFLTSLATSHAA